MFEFISECARAVEGRTNKLYNIIYRKHAAVVMSSVAFSQSGNVKIISNNCCHTVKINGFTKPAFHA